MEIKNPVYFENRKQWRSWLKQNHNKLNEVWLVYYKKHTGKKRIPYDDAVEEALCYGWIDSTVKRIDDEKFCQKFTPRKKNSNWSESNKKRVRKLLKKNLITKYGMEKINIAKENGKWDEKTVPQKDFEIAEEFVELLSQNNKANNNFSSLSPSHKKQYINWISSAKKKETRVRRSQKAIQLLLLNKNLGMK